MPGLECPYRVRSLLCATIFACSFTVLYARADAIPTDGLILWLDASDIDADGVTENNPKTGAGIARWTDKSSQKNHVEQTVNDRQPTFQRGALGGVPVVRFQGKDVLQRRPIRGLQPGDRPFHAVFVMKARMVNPQTNPRLLDLRSDNGDTKKDPRRGFWVGYQGNGRNRLGITNGDEGEATQVAWNGEPNLLEVVYQGSGRWAQYLNGEPDGSGVFGTRTFLGFRSDIRLAIGQHYGATHPNTWYAGDLAEVLLYNRVLSASEQNVLGNYLTQKYRLDTNYGPALRFEKDIAPILAKRCCKCHGAKTREAELDLRTVSAMLKGGESGAVLVRGHPENSELLEMITAGKMPPEDEPPLTRKEIARLRRWIKLGAPADERIELPSAAALVSEKDRQHPAYQKLKRPNPPRVEQPDRVRTPIDAFLLARLEEKGLSFSPEAGRATLARRAWFDLIGLPPSPSELTEFLEDKRPDAYERLVSRLLDSPHFGERWGRHWLDAAGYVDVYGSDNDAATIKPLAGKWRYRDYVVQSFNQDKPFDRFLVEQLAGDELFDWRSAKSFTPEMRDALIATGFLLCAADSTGSPELNTPDIRHRVLQVTGEIVASNLLALTVNCAKCHNHKYEAIPQIDYYRWMAVFSPAFNPQRWVIATGHEVKDPSLGKIQVVYEHHPPSPTFLLRRGNHLKPGTEVLPGLLTVLSEGETSERVEREGGSKLLHDSPSREEPRHDDSESRPTVVLKLPRTSVSKQSSGRRLAIARELTDPRTRASALMARVMVNRIWQHLFGKGIVTTSENFGVSGAPPTHPELLEWLAAEWIEGDWRTKPLIRRIMTSRAYRQSSIRGAGTASKDNSAADSVDPDNSLYWRMPLRRLEAEAIRDSILTASGKLDASLGGPPIPLEVRPDGKVVTKTKDDAKTRRSIYVLARRNYHLSLLDTFDQPIVATNCTRRPSSAVVSQPLTMLNDDYIVKQAGFFADRVFQAADAPQQRIAWTFQAALTRQPTAKEFQWCVEFLEKHTKRYQNEGKDRQQSERLAMKHLCHMLFNTSEFLYVP